MSQDDDRQASQGDAEDRRRRAADLHEQIDQLKSGSPANQPARPRQPSPRDVTEQSVREELEREHKRASDED